MSTAIDASSCVDSAELRHTSALKLGSIFVEPHPWTPFELDEGRRAQR